MASSSFCVCRTASLRIFVRGLLGPLLPAPPARPARSQFSRSHQTISWAATSQSPFQCQRTNLLRRAANIRDGRGQRRSRICRQASTVAEALVDENVHVGDPGVCLPTVAAEYSVQSNSLRTLPAEELPDARPEVTSKRRTGNASEVVLGKNARKRLRRKQENELRQSEHVASEAAAMDETAKLDVGEAVKLPREKKKKSTGRKFEEDKPREQREAQQKLPKQMREARNRRKMATANETDAPAPYQKAKRAESADRMVERNVRKEAKKARETLERPPKMTSEKAGAGPSPPSPQQGPLHQARSAEPWQVQKRALQSKFPEGWNPRKKLSPDALEGIRALHRQFPETYTTATLARHFQVSPEAIRRILKSSWQASPEVEEDRQARWFGRGKQVWSRWAELGRKPPKRWQAEGIRRDPMSWPGGRKRLMARQQLQTRQSRQAFQSQLSAEGTHDRSVMETDKSDVFYAGTQSTVRKESTEADVPSPPSRARTSSKGRKLRLQLAGLDPNSKA